MKTKSEIIEFKIQYKIEYDSDELKEKAIKDILKNGTTYCQAFTNEGYYGVKQGKIKK